MIGAAIERDGHHEVAADPAGDELGGYRQATALADQCLMQRTCLVACQHGGDELELEALRMGSLRHRPYQPKHSAMRDRRVDPEPSPGRERRDPALVRTLSAGGGDRREMRAHEIQRHPRFDRTADHDRGVVGRVEPAVPGACAVQRHGADILRRADHRMMIGMAGRVEVGAGDLGQFTQPATGALGFFLKDDRFLLGQPLFGQMFPKAAHAIGFGVKREREHAGWNGLEETGEVRCRKGVHLGRAGFGQHRAVHPREIGAPGEHEMFEEVGAARLSRTFVLRSDTVADR